MIRKPGDSDAAIVGMACLLPGAPNLETYRENLEAGVDAIVEAPADRIDPVLYDPDSDAIDRLYCNRGGFVDEHARFDPLRWGLMPVTVEGSEPEQLLALDVAAEALADAGYRDRDELGSRGETAAVILGRGSYPGPRLTGLIQMVRSSLEVERSVEHLVPGLDREQLDEVRRSYQRKIEGVRPDTLIGLTPNLVASRIANRLDLHGPAYTIDAACASSLVAVDRAVGDLASGRADLVLAGGVHLNQGEGFWSVFCQMGAMSRRQRCRPFDRAADGLLMGEGLGFVVLKRLADARRDGDRVYAVVRGTGLSSDGRSSSVMNPRSASQVMAIERAWEAAGLDPTASGSVGYLEAHGTGTPIGDETELRTLADAFGADPGDGPRPGLGSVKSMIGHAMPAAGIAGLIKVALSIHHGRRYPTLHVDDPHPDLAGTRFRLQTEVGPWEEPDGPRRAGVNAFGFGGINAHVVLEGVDSRPRVRGARDVRRRRALLLAGRDPGEVIEGLDRGISRPDAPGACRLAVLDPDAERLAAAREIVARGERHSERDGSLTFTPRGLLADGGELAFVFPGVEGEFRADLDDVAAALGAPAPPRVGPDDLETIGVVIIEVSRMMNRILRRAGIAPDRVAGHSIGEWSALIASGTISEESVEEILAELQPGTLEVPGVVFAAAGADLARIEPVLERFPDVHVSLENCPHQTVVCGPEKSIENLVEVLREARVPSLVLPFRSGFHTPHFEPYVDPMRSMLEEIEIETPRVPIWSTITCEPFPDDPDGIRELVLEHFVRPVRFRTLVERMYDAGTRVFVQVGQGNLPGFVGDTLRGRPHAALTAIDPRRSGFDQLARMAAPLWVEGAAFEIESFLEPVGTRASSDPENGRGAGARLPLGAPFVHATGRLRGVPTEAAPVDEEVDETDPVLGTFERSMREIERARREVHAAWKARRSKPDPLGPRSSTTRRRVSLEDQPYLRDHSFYPLPDGWPDPSDGFPTVPLTMSVEMMIEAAAQLVPERTVVEVREVRAFRWILLEEPRTIEIDAAFDGDAEVHVRIGDAVEGRVVLADRRPAPPVGSSDPVGRADPELGAIDMYRDRYMFHGPAYRSVARLGKNGPDGIRARVRRLPAEGSLLDVVPQLTGFWIVWNESENQVSFPALIDRIALFGSEPEVGAELEAEVRIRYAGARQVRSDVELVRDDGTVWARVEGLLIRRNAVEASHELVVRRPERNGLAEPLPESPDVCWLDVEFGEATARDYFAGLYLTGAERASYRALPEAEKEPWVRARMVARDVVRHRLWREGRGAVYPIEIELRGTPPIRAGLWNDPSVDLHLAIARAGDGVAARVGETPVDLEARRTGEPGPESNRDASVRMARRGEWILAWTEEG